MAKDWLELASALERKRLRIRLNKGIDPANDGPEVEVIRFFSRFPKGATCFCAPPFAMWKEIASRVNPNACA